MIKNQFNKILILIVLLILGLFSFTFYLFYNNKNLTNKSINDVNINQNSNLIDTEVKIKDLKIFSQDTLINARKDSDGDGIFDDSELKLNKNPEQADFNLTNIDSDKDGLTDDDELFFKTDPLNPDTDGDDVPDFAELDSGGNMLIKDNPMTDSDNDGLNDYEEINKYLTDPNTNDTDSDGFNDGDEVKKGYNPNGPGLLIK